MDTSSGEPWTEMDVWELKYSMECGRSLAEVAGFLYRDESEVRQMADALGLKEGGRISQAKLHLQAPHVAMDAVRSAALR
jgi:hypothetical protein